MSISIPFGLAVLATAASAFGVLSYLLFRLQQSQQRFRLLAENATDLVCLHDAGGSYLWASPSSKNLLGYEPRDMVGRHPKDFLHPDDIPACREMMAGAANLANQVGSHRVVCRMRHKDGTFVWVETLAESFKAKCRGGLQIRSSSQDVTKRKQAESLYLLLIANLPNTSVFLFDRKMSHLVAEGAVAETYMGPDGLHTDLPPDVARLLFQHYQAALRGETPVIEESFQMRNYRIHFLPVNGKQDDGLHDMGMAVFHDVTEEKAVVSVLEEKTTDLERSNRDLEQFANVASHELKAPLRRISSFAELLSTEYQGALSGEADKYLGHIIDGVGTLHGVIESLLTYSRVQTDKTRMDWVDMEQVFADAIENLGILIHERNAQVTAGMLPDMVTGDEVLLRQLLENLIGNAIKFNTTGRQPRVHVSSKRDLLDWQFCVQDNGPGIAEEFRDKVFTMFSRLRPEIEGNGIGLALCKKIVGIHRGTIRYESAVGQGTAFYFALPARSPEDVTDKIPIDRG